MSEEGSPSIHSHGGAPLWLPKHSPWLITISVLLATFMEVLDTSIANVALPHIAGSLSATTEESTWILTSYLISNAIILSAAGWLSRYFGRKRYLAFSVILFTLSSVLCGMARSLPFLIFARVLQGVGGGGLQPLAQAVLLESFPPRERGTAMAAYGMGIVVAPIIGPMLGGWITDNYSWRWIFYINIPIGLLGLFLQQIFLEDPPYLKFTRAIKIDYVGFGLLAVGLGWLQVILDKGQQSDWFGAVWIRWSSLAVFLLLFFLVVWEWRHKDPIINMRLFLNRNFATAAGLIALVGAVLYGSTVLLPVFMQTLLGYPAYRSGLAMTPRGIGSFLSMLIVGRLIKRMDMRLMMLCGFLGLGVSSWYLSRLSLNISQANISWPLVFNGLSMGFIFVPLTTLSVATLRQEHIYQSTSLYALTRNTGASIGISLLVAFQSRWSQGHQLLLSAHLTADNPLLNRRVSSLTEVLGRGGLSQPQAQAGALRYVYASLLQQASLLSYMDCFLVMATVSLLCVPLVFLFRKGHTGGSPAVME